MPKWLSRRSARPSTLSQPLNPVSEGDLRWKIQEMGQEEERFITYDDFERLFGAVPLQDEAAMRKAATCFLSELVMIRIAEEEARVYIKRTRFRPGEAKVKPDWDAY